jgi:hypothetical protein
MRGVEYEFREDDVPETEFPRIKALGSWVNKGTWQKRDLTPVSSFDISLLCF